MFCKISFTLKKYILLCVLMSVCDVKNLANNIFFIYTDLKIYTYLDIYYPSNNIFLR